MAPVAVVYGKSIRAPVSFGFPSDGLGSEF